MWFLIRCAFWLSIVFALLPWPDNSGFGSSPPAAIWSRTRDAIGAAIVKARAAGEKICTDSPLECLKAAAQLDQYAADQRVEGGPAAGGAAKPSSTPGGDAKALPTTQSKSASARSSPAGQLKAASTAPPER